MVIRINFQFVAFLKWNFYYYAQTCAYKFDIFNNNYFVSSCKAYYSNYSETEGESDVSSEFEELIK